MSNTKPNVLLIGDSHAAHFYPGLAAQTDINVLQATASGCRPIDGAGGELRCTSLMNFITNEFLPTNRVDTVIISGRWLDGDAPSLVAEIEKIQKFTPRVIVFGPIAEYDQALPRILAESMYSNSPNTVTAHRLQARELLDKVIKNAVATTGAEYVSIYDALCPAGNCTLWTDDGNPIQSDYGHLTNEGSKEMIRRIQGQILPRQVLSGSL
jgi:hypothetical protein